MKKIQVILSFTLLAASLSLTFSSCSQENPEPSLIDPDATTETRALFRNLLMLSEDHIMFGHQHATEYGHGWYGDHDRSDVKSVSGSHPAVIGMDLSGITRLDPEENLARGIEMYQHIRRTYERGGLTTLSWHFHNPLSEGGFYWKQDVSEASVKHLIPGGYGHDTYKAILDDLAGWFNMLRGADNELIPVIFRPYHEYDGSWFWWGADHCTPDEFKSLWKFTVSYLRDSLDVHNVIWAFSPDNKFDSEEEFLARYPGDEWVDMVGMDNYADLGRDRYDIQTAADKLKIVSDYAEKAGKLAAFTETGLESIPDTTWWTSTLLQTLQTHELKLSYVLVWRNDSRSPTHYYAPHPGHPSIPDFLSFYRDPYTLFENELPELYRSQE